MTTNNQKYTFVDLFAGAGGFGLGFQMSGRFFPLCSIEKDLWAVETLRVNNQHTIIHADITKISTKAYIKKMCKEAPDIIIGGPPCQGFSIAGKGDPSDPRNALFRYFVKWVKVLMPKVFVMENVTGLLMRKNARGRKVIEIIKEAFVTVGYTCQIWVLNAADYGVPQMRQRIFIVGNCFGKEVPIPQPTHSINGKQNLTPYITSWEAISDLPHIAANEGSEYMDYNKPTIWLHFTRAHGFYQLQKQTQKQTQIIASVFVSAQEFILIINLSANNSLIQFISQEPSYT